MTTYKFKLNGLHCANCANKIENEISKDTSTDKTFLNFSTKTLSFKSKKTNEKEVKGWVQNVVNGIEDGVQVTINDENEQKPENSKLVWGKIIVSALLFIAAALMQNVFELPTWAYAVFYGAAVILCGYPVFISGIKAVLKLRLDENTLMAIAVISAFCIQEFPEAALVTLLFSIGEALEDHAVNRSRRDIEKLAEIRPDTANLVTPEGTQAIAAERVSIGDTIIVNPFERVPLDGEVTSGQSNLDTSALTGESMLEFASTGTKVMSGMMNQEGLLTVNVTSTYENSSASRILSMVEEAAATKGSSEKFITKFARVYTPLVLLAAILLTAIPGLITGDFLTWFNRSLVFLVASCPCAIVISVPLSFYSGIGGASKLGVIIKGGKFIEALAKSDAFVFDKTGTLTTGKLNVTEVHTTGSLSKDELIALAAAAEAHSAHPVAQAIKALATNKSLTPPTLTDYSEIAGIGVKAMYNEKQVLCGSHRIFPDNDGEKGTIYLMLNGKLEGEFIISDTLRTETPNVIAQLKQLGAKTITMLTGDSNTAAQSIAAKAKLTEVHAELLPDEKVTHLTSIKEKSKFTVYVGDGINDSPVLAASDCGIAMGLGSQAAIEAADVVLASGNLKPLPQAIKHSRNVMKTVYSNIIFALGVKAIVLSLAAIGIAPMWLAVIADTGVSLLCVLNASRVLKPNI